MRSIAGILGLLVVLAIMGLLAKTPLGGMGDPPTAPQATGVSTHDATPQQRSQQIQQQVQQSVDGALQARPMPDDDK